MSLESPTFTIVRSTPGNIHLLVPLYNRVFGQSKDPAHFIRKYSSRNSRNGQFFSYMALNQKGSCVAHYAAVPAFFEIGEEKYWGGQGCDAVSDPEVRRMGVFSQVGRMVEEALIAEGADFLFCFANEYSAVAVERGQGLIPLFQIQGHRIGIPTFPLEKICRRSGFLQQPYLWIVNQVLRRHASTRMIPNSCRSPEQLTIVHDDAFFQQKNRVIGIEIAGETLWLKVNGGMLVGDMNIGNLENAVFALRKLKRICFFLGINEIIFQCSPGIPLDHFLRGKAAQFPSWTIMVKAFRSDLDLSALKLVYGDMDTF